MYNYLENVKNDVLEAMEENEILEKLHYFETRDDFEVWLHDTLWDWDSVTGNGSGSYTFSTYQAEEYLCHNWELLSEANDAFGSGMDVLKDGAETCDVAIRCYLLAQAISEVLDENYSKYFESDLLEW